MLEEIDGPGVVAGEEGCIGGGEMETDRWGSGNRTVGRAPQNGEGSVARDIGLRAGRGTEGLRCAPTSGVAVRLVTLGTGFGLDCATVCAFFLSLSLSLSRSRSLSFFSLLLSRFSSSVFSTAR